CVTGGHTGSIFYSLYYGFKSW
nr:immunoglobulin heavy chain junction region [Macaca mulatta]MOW98975.1 immunoglobulin heavy chain junction region [Macaca mulatta]MOX00028.1 immunoglobulin heavy chain junction region [Macaca mulatta]MOX01344.1 immunoglobulin heavy chain junction region [Macaca mulatta]MOX03752.1 immunoglobulin heavy chain junction region [Macaca mulatta]